MCGWREDGPYLIEQTREQLNESIWRSVNAEESEA